MMLETYIVDRKICSWKHFEEQVKAHPNIPLTLHEKQVTMDEYLKYARPKIRYQRVTFDLITPEYAEQINNSNGRLPLIRPFSLF